MAGLTYKIMIVTAIITESEQELMAMLVLSVLDLGLKCHVEIVFNMYADILWSDHYIKAYKSLAIYCNTVIYYILYLS